MHAAGASFCPRPLPALPALHWALSGSGPRHQAARRVARKQACEFCARPALTRCRGLGLSLCAGHNSDAKIPKARVLPARATGLNSRPVLMAVSSLYGVVAPDAAVDTDGLSSSEAPAPWSPGEVLAAQRGRRQHQPRRSRCAAGPSREVGHWFTMPSVRPPEHLWSMSPSQQPQKPLPSGPPHSSQVGRGARAHRNVTSPQGSRGLAATPRGCSAGSLFCPESLILTTRCRRPAPPSPFLRLTAPQAQTERQVLIRMWGFPPGSGGLGRECPQLRDPLQLRVPRVVGLGQLSLGQGVFTDAPLLGGPFGGQTLVLGSVCVCVEGPWSSRWGTPARRRCCPPPRGGHRPLCRLCQFQPKQRVLFSKLRKTVPVS